MTNLSESDIGRRRQPALRGRRRQPAPRARLPAQQPLGQPVSLDTPTSGIVSAIAIAFLLAMLLLRPFTRLSSLDVVEPSAPPAVDRLR